MRSIGQQLGYSHGSLYYHFKDKAELFYALVQEDFRILGHLFERVLSQSPADGMSKLEQVMLEFISYGLNHPHHYEIMFMTRDEDIPRSLFLSMHGFISYYIQDQVTYDEVKPAAAAHVRFLCLKAFEEATQSAS